MRHLTMLYLRTWHCIGRPVVFGLCTHSRGVPCHQICHLSLFQLAGPFTCLGYVETQSHISPHVGRLATQHTSKFNFVEEVRNMTLKVLIYLGELKRSQFDSGSTNASFAICC